MIQQSSKGWTEIIMGSGFICVPIVLAATVADAAIGTACAFFWLDRTALQEGCILRACKQLIHGHFLQAAHSPVIKDIEVAGICGTVTFNYQIGTAFSTCGTGAGTISQKNVNVVIKQSDAVIVSR